MHPLAVALKGTIPPERIRMARYDPVVRTPHFWTVKVPDKQREGEPFTVVKVETAEEISRILRLANQRRAPVYVRQGMGQIWMDVIRPEPPGSLVLDLSTMKEIRPNFERNYVEIGPAVTEKELNSFLAPYGYSYPELIGPVTWGGSLVSLNSSGRSVDPHIGKPRDYVLGLRAVLPTGEIVETGTQGLRRPCSFDLTQLLIGGQCLFGVITTIRLRLVPTPRDIKGAVVHFSSLESLGKGVAALYRSRVPYPRILEVLDHNYLEMMEFDGPRPPAALLTGTQGTAPGEAEWKLDEIIKVLRQTGATEARKASSEEWQGLLEFREAGLSKLVPRGLCMLLGEVLDFPLDKLPQALAGILPLQERMVAAYPGLQIFIIGHIGAGSFHATFSAPVAWGYMRLREVATHLKDEVLKYKLDNGATIGEQGVLPGHREWFLGTTNGELHMNALRAIKRAMDPNLILNPLRMEDWRAGVPKAAPGRAV